MKNVTKIIDLFGGLEALKADYLRVESPGFMPLVIEAIGPGPRGLPQVSVAHYYTQNGDAMRDPDVVFEVDPAGQWIPVSYRQDGLGIYQEAAYVDDDGKVMIAPKLIRDLTTFARQWDRNIGEQGFVDAAKRQHANGIRVSRSSER